MSFETDINKVLKMKLETIEELKQELKEKETILETITDSDVIASMKISIDRLKYSIRDEYNSIEFYRTPIPEDVDYRINYLTSKSFIKNLSDSFPENLPLRFHGSPIHRSKQIIESGFISSSVDRLGFETSTNNLSNQISCYDRNFLRSSIINYTDLNDIYKPLGCLFVLIDSNSSDVISQGLCSMPNFNLKDDSDKLFGIITSPESVPIVKDWCNQHGIDSNKVFDYNEFIEHMKQSKKVEMTIG